MSYVRSWARTLFFAPLVLLSFSYSAFAAGSYNESFDSDPPASWVESVDAWSATSGYYTNATTAPFRAIAYFSERRWTTDFTYSLRMYSDLAGTGNHRVGVVFNYVDDMNYYEVVINMLGDVELNQVSGGVRSSSPLATGHSNVPAIDTWFDVAVTRSGNNTVRVRIGNEDVLTYAALTSPAAGYIGVLSQYNWGRFDDVKVTPVVYRSGFGAGLSVTAPPGVCAGTKRQLNLTGTETATGTVWPPVFWGSPTVVLMNTILDCTNDFSTYLDAGLKTVTAPNGQTSQVISNTVKNVTPQPDGNIARLGLSYTVGAEGDIPHRFYVRRYLKYSSALANPGNGMWFMQQEFKNMSCNDPEPPRRLTLGMLTTSTGVPYYRLRMDQENTICDVPNSTQPVAEFPDQTCYPRSGGPCPDFTQTTGQWFYDEYLVQYSTNGSSADRVAYAINGQVIFNYFGPVRTTQPRGIKLTPGYINIPNLEVQADDLEIYHDAPCRTFPCGAPSHY
jgi:hypothetical protein